MYKICYDSKGVYPYCDDKKILKLPNLYGFVENTQVHCIHEHVYAVVLQRGSISIRDMDGAVLAELTVTPDTKNGMHDNCYCKVEAGKLVLWFPQVRYIDNYPYCDGEYDRWDVVYTGYERVAFDLTDHAVERINVKELV